MPPKKPISRTIASKQNISILKEISVEFCKYFIKRKGKIRYAGIKDLIDTFNIPTTKQTLFATVRSVLKQCLEYRSPFSLSPEDLQKTYNHLLSNGRARGSNREFVLEILTIISKLDPRVIEGGVDYVKTATPVSHDSTEDGSTTEDDVYRKRLKNRFLTTSIAPQTYDLHSRLAHEQWSLAPDQNFEGSPCQIPDSSIHFGIEKEQQQSVIDLTHDQDTADPVSHDSLPEQNDVEFAANLLIHFATKR